MYGERIRIGPSAVPPFADCRYGTKIEPHLLAYCQDALGLDVKAAPFSQHFGFAGAIGEVDATPCAVAAKVSAPPEDPLRTYFKDVGVLACRPAAEGGMGIGIKSGGNFSHSHNDVGSYEIALGDLEPTGDPGGPLYYDKDVFSTKRYSRSLFNSCGHPVPVIGGQLQIDATKAKPVVLSTSFSPRRDEIVINMAPAYAAGSLRTLTRTMDYERTGTGKVIITDEAAFSTPTSFEDALITHGDWRQIGPDKLSIGVEGARVTVEISASGAYALKPETITELGVTFTRVGLVFSKPVLSARVGLTFTQMR